MTSLIFIAILIPFLAMAKTDPVLDKQKDNSAGLNKTGKIEQVTPSPTPAPEVKKPTVSTITHRRTYQKRTEWFPAYAMMCYARPLW